MKILHKTLLALVAGCVVSMSAQAVPGYGYSFSQNNNTYAGLKAGQFKADVDGVDNLTAYGVYMGHQFTPNWGMEAEYLTSKEKLSTVAIDGSVVEGVDLSNVQVGFAAETVGLYGTYRYVFPNNTVYLKGKLGVANTKTDLALKADGTKANISFDKTNVGGGIGMGYLLSHNFGVEAEYSMLKGELTDIDLITIGANFKF